MPEPGEGLNEAAPASAERSDHQRGQTNPPEVTSSRVAASWRGTRAEGAGSPPWSAGVYTVTIWPLYPRFPPRRGTLEQPRKSPGIIRGLSN